MANSVDPFRGPIVAIVTAVLMVVPFRLAGANAEPTAASSAETSQPANDAEVPGPREPMDAEGKAAPDRAQLSAGDLANELAALAATAQWPAIIARGLPTLASSAAVESVADADIHAAVCHLGLAYEATARPALATAYLEWCAELNPDTPIPVFARALKRAKQAVTNSARAPVSFIGTPQGAKISIDGEWSGHRLLLVRELWLAKGDYRGTIAAPGFASKEVVVQISSPDRQSIMVSLRPDTVAKSKTTTVDFADDAGPGAADTVAVRDPKPTKHASLLPDRYQKIVSAEADSTNAIASPQAAATQWLLSVDAGAAVAVGNAAGAYVGVAAGISIGLSQRWSLVPAAGVYWEVAGANPGAHLGGGLAVLFAALPRQGIAVGVATQIDTRLGESPTRRTLSGGPVVTWQRGFSRAAVGAHFY